MNLRYSCNLLYPEVILVTMALNDLIQFRMSRLAKSRYGFDAPLDKAVKEYQCAEGDLRFDDLQYPEHIDW